MNILRSAPLFFALVFSLSANALPIYETVTPGEFLSIGFKFKADTGNADVLLASGGALSQGLLGSNVELFVGNALVAAWTNPMANTFAVFKEADSFYTAWGTTTELDDIFDGANARMEFHPIFDASAVNAHVDYQLNFFGAAESLADGSLSDQIIAPKIKSVSVLEEKKPHASVPEPSSIALFWTGLLGLAVNRRRLPAVVDFSEWVGRCTDNH